MASLNPTNGYWRLNVKVHGEMKRKEFRNLSTTQSRNQLLNIANDLESNLATGTANSPELTKRIQLLGPEVREKLFKVGLLSKSIRNDPLKLREFLDQQLATEKRRLDAGEITIETYEKLKNTSNQACNFFKADRDIREIRPTDAGKYRDHRLHAAKKARATVQSEIKHLRKFFKHGVESEVLATNPFEKCVVSTAKPKDERRTFLGRTILKQVEDSIQNINWRALFAICRWTGCRQSEALKLKWRGIDPNKKRITMPCPKTAKSGSSERDMPLFDELRPTLEALYQHQGNPSPDSYVIQNILSLPRTNREDRSRPAKNAGTTMIKLVEKAGVKPWDKIFQNLRVTRENELLQSGEYRKDAVHAFIGHSKEVFQSNYRQLNDEDFIAKSERALGAGEISTTESPRNAQAEPSNPTATTGNAYKNKNLLGIASNCNPSRLSNAPRLGELTVPENRGNQQLFELLHHLSTMPDFLDTLEAVMQQVKLNRGS